VELTSTVGPASAAAAAGGLYGLAALCIISAAVCALFLDIPDPAATTRRGALKVGAH
jgi:hypothetical protein